jgi:hypothetical protein
VKTLIYEIDDHDVTNTFFGEEPRYKAIIDICRDHGDLIFEGDLTPVADCGDVIGIDTDEEVGKNADGEPIFKQAEYVILVRYNHADTDSLYLLVHERHQVEVELS